MDQAEQAAQDVNKLVLDLVTGEVWPQLKWSDWDATDRGALVRLRYQDNSELVLNLEIQ